MALLHSVIGKTHISGCLSDTPLAHLGEPVQEFTLDPKDKSKICLKILHFPLPVA